MARSSVLEKLYELRSVLADLNRELEDIETSDSVIISSDQPNKPSKNYNGANGNHRHPERQFISMQPTLTKNAPPQSRKNASQTLATTQSGGGGGQIRFHNVNFGNNDPGNFKGASLDFSNLTTARVPIFCQPAIPGKTNSGTSSSAAENGVNSVFSRNKKLGTEPQHDANHKEVGTVLMGIAYDSAVTNGSFFYRCAQCGCRFSHKHGFDRHECVMKETNPHTYCIAQFTPTPMRYTCTNSGCGETFDSLYELDLHHISVRQRIATCILCPNDQTPELFETLDALLQHVRAYHTTRTVAHFGSGTVLLTREDTSWRVPSAAPFA